MHRILCAAAFAVGLSSWAPIAQAQTSDPDGPTAGVAREAITRVTSTAKNLVSSVMVDGKVFANYAAGDVAIDPVRTLSCPTAPCTLEITIVVGVSDVDVAHGSFWLCTKVDGAFAGTCPFLGETGSTDVDSGNFYNVRTVSTIVTGLAAGSHQAQGLVRLERRSGIGRYFLAYRMYR